MTLLLGCIADDFTGATDLANTLLKQGMKTVQLIGVPHSQTDAGDAEAVVIALKSRTAPVSDAIDWSLQSLAWLKARGTRQFFFKYCSTFDSTDEGNIGPVADALLESLEQDFAIVCPAFPANERTVYKGNLFVSDVLLSESGMRNHPLTPMNDSNLARVLGRQSKAAIGTIDYDIVRQGAACIANEFHRQRKAGNRYVVVDAITDDDLICIGSAAADLVLITGGSGIALGLPDNFRNAGLIGETAPAAIEPRQGRRAVLSGSCSIASRAQLATIKDIWPNYEIDPVKINDSFDLVADILAWVRNQPDTLPVVISSSASPAALARIQARIGQQHAADLIESVFGKLATGLVGLGVDQLIVAGGETSGSVISALGIEGLRIGPEIDPGVPWCETLGAGKIAVALKSGNFGTEHFFEKAFNLLP